VDCLCAEGRKDGIEEGIATVAKKLLEMRMPIADIAEATGLSRAEIEGLRDGDRTDGGTGSMRKRLP
jgi:predicted transposase YdaD